MTTPKVLQFMQKTAQDQKLQQQLQALLGVGDGNISSRAALDEQEAEALKGDHAPMVVKFAAEQGFEFSVAELTTMVDAFQRYQSGELSDQEFAKLIGLPTQNQGSNENLSSIKQTVELIYRGTRYQKIDGRLVPIGQPTATPKVLQFMQKTAQDEKLQQQLQALLGVGDGNISSRAALDEQEAQALKGDRAPMIVKFAAEQGFEFSVAELTTMVDAFQRYQSGAISDEDFAKLIGLPNQNLSSIKQTAELIYRGTRYQKIDGRLVPIGQPTATPKVLQFMQKTAEDPQLQQQLQALLGVGDGNISSRAALDEQEAQALKGDRAPMIVKFAAEQGFEFSVAELTTMVDAFQRYQSGAISDEDFAKLIGLPNQNLSSIKQTAELIYRGTRYQKIDGRLVPIGQPTATPKVLQFMQKTAQDPQLQQQLQALLGVGDGNISSRAALDEAEAEALKGDRAPMIVKFAAEQGFEFSVAELTTMVDAFQRYQSGAISDEDFAKLIGLSSQNESSKQSLPSIKKLVDFVYRGIRNR